MKTRTLCLSIGIAAAAMAVGGVAFAARPHETSGSTPHAPSASSFSARVDNQWFPLEPGTRYVYIGVKDAQPSRDVVRVTHRTRTIDGAPCVVVQDRLYLRGRLQERTTDWYSQDAHGTVWYFGENTAELDPHGHVTSTEGSWRAGVDGAAPGIFMPARLQVGRAYRQEFYKGHAEDHFKVIGLFGSVTARGRRSVLLTEEWTPLEPGTIDHKMYVRGIGNVLEQTQRGGNERAELVSVRRSS
jgi:hypothetical protein